MKRISKASVLIVMAFSVMLAGCAAQVVHPGAANKFDSSSYDTLLVTHSVIESTKADLAANKFTPTVASGVRNALNGLIAAYNVAEASYMAYHSAALAGTASTSQQSQLQVQLMSVQTATTQLSTSKAAQ